MAASALNSARVSRRGLALNRSVWLAQAVMFAILAASTVVIAVGPFGFDQRNLLILSAGLTLVAITLLLTKPQPVDSLGNHLAVASTYLGAGAAMVAFAPQTSAVAAAIMFAGPLTAMRLVTRQEITGHLVLATVCVVGPARYAEADPQHLIGLSTLVIGVWVLGGCCVLVFETAEAQGEALEKLVSRDPLTGLGNERMFTQELSRALRRHQRAHRPLTLVAIDLDGFREVNATLGHAAGASLLQRVAAELVATARPQDLVTRPGGDRFFLLLPNTAPETAPRSLAAVRAALAACGVTAGIGVASYPRDAVHDKVLLQLIDDRLLEDKAAPGRVSAPPAPAPLRIVPDDRQTL